MSFQSRAGLNPVLRAKPIGGLNPVLETEFMVGVRDAVAAGWLVSGMPLFQCHDNHNAGLRSPSLLLGMLVFQCHDNHNAGLRAKSFVAFRDPVVPKCHADRNRNPVLEAEVFR